MKLKDILKRNEYIAPSSTDKGAVEMGLPNIYDKKNRGIGATTKVRKEKITLHSTGTGKIYGRRTLYQKATS